MIRMHIGDRLQTVELPDEARDEANIVESWLKAHEKTNPNADAVGAVLLVLREDQKRANYQALELENLRQTIEGHTNRGKIAFEKTLELERQLANARNELMLTNAAIREYQRERAAHLKDITALERELHARGEGALRTARDLLRNLVLRLLP